MAVMGHVTVVRRRWLDYDESAWWLVMVDGGFGAVSVTVECSIGIVLGVEPRP
jgi:hypothetical protein